MTQLDRLADGNTALIELLTAQQLFHDSVLASVADLYTRIGGSIASGIWAWTASNLPAAGEFHIDVLGTTDRRFFISEVDADGQTVDFGGFTAGDSLTLLDDPATPPTTGFRQYVAATAPTDQGGWRQFDAVRTAVFGPQDFPTPGTRIELLFG